MRGRRLERMQPVSLPRPHHMNFTEITALRNGIIRQLDDEIAVLDEKTLYVRSYSPGVSGVM